MAPRNTTGSPYLIQTSSLRRALQGIQAEVDSKTRQARRIIGNESVTMLRSTQSSLVNVDTGLMRRSFRFKVARGNNRIDIFNLARSNKGFRYPILIERRYGGARATIIANRRRIIRYSNLELARPERTGRYRNELG